MPLATKYYFFDLLNKNYKNHNKSMIILVWCRPVTETHTEPSPGPGSRTLLGLENVTQLGMMAPPTTAEKVRERSSRQSAATQVRGVQTDYRETEAQTLPWTPPYTVRGRRTPELLQLDQLSWGESVDQVIRQLSSCSSS